MGVNTMLLRLLTTTVVAHFEEYSPYIRGIGPISSIDTDLIRLKPVMTASMPKSLQQGEFLGSWKMSTKTVSCDKVAVAC